MVRTLVFKKNLKIKDLSSPNIKPKKNEIVWTHLVKNEDKFIDIIINDLNTPENEDSNEFKEDLIEKQRPGLLNFSNFSFVNISVPSPDLVNANTKSSGLLQISFIVKRNKIFSIADKTSGIITDVIEEIKKEKMQDFSATYVMYRVLEELIEYGIDITEQLKKKIDQLQRQIIDPNSVGEMNKTYEMLENLKETSFFASKSLRADIEVLKEIYSNKGKFIAVPEFDNHLEDRFLYCWDLLETQKDSLNGTYNLYLAAQSNQMNKQIYKLSWIAAFLIIPTIVSGFFGMNVDLPINNFWLIGAFTIILSTVIAILLRK